jgi:hypothetical protein
MGHILAEHEKDSDRTTNFQLNFHLPAHTPYTNTNFLRLFKYSNMVALGVRVKAWVEANPGTKCRGSTKMPNPEHTCMSLRALSPKLMLKIRAPFAMP